MQRTLFNAVSTQVKRSAVPSVRANVILPRSSSQASARFLSFSPRVYYPGPNPAPTASEDVVHAEKHHPDPLANSSTSTSTSAVADEHDPQHPGPVGPDHLENPSLSEAFVHADRHAEDPLKGKTANASTASSAASSAAAAASSAAESAQGAAAGIADAAGKVAEKVKDAVGLGSNKRAFSTSARQLAPKEDDAKPAMHLDESGHEHLDKPSVSEEEVHADKSNKDPLAGTGQKASDKKGDKAGIADSKSQKPSN